ncbi:MAG: hypothetical protein ABSD48_16470 [Armatimonadota bacterium]|jgi:hypothetical protein
MELHSKADGLLARVEQDWSEYYAQLGALRAAIQLIPIVGPPIDTLIGTRGANITVRRLNALLEELRNQAAKLDASKIDHEYLESESFFDIVRRAFEQSQRTAAEENLRLYARILLRTAEGAAYRENAQEYLDLVSGLSMPEIRISSALYSLQRNAKFDAENALKKPDVTHTGADISQILPDMTPTLIDSYLKRIERTGLVREVVGSYAGYTGGNYYITDYFRNMMVFLALHDLVAALY